MAESKVQSSHGRPVMAFSPKTTVVRAEDRETVARRRRQQERRQRGSAPASALAPAHCAP